MNKIERNEMIIKNVQMDKTQSEIANELGCSIRTVRRVIEEHFGSTTRAKSPIGQNDFYITEEMWESLQDKIDSLLDTIDIQSAKIAELEADVIKAKTIKTNKAVINQLESDEGFIVSLDGGEQQFMNFKNIEKEIKTRIGDIPDPISWLNRQLEGKEYCRCRGLVVYQNLSQRIEKLKNENGGLNYTISTLVGAIEKLSN